MKVIFHVQGMMPAGQSHSGRYDVQCINRPFAFVIFCFVNCLPARLLFILLMASGLSSADCFAQAPKYSNEFLAIGVGGRAFGMSNACVATIDDVTAGYWNPAGLLHIKNDMQFGLMHSEYFAGIAKYDYAALARKIDSSSAFALSFIRFGVDNIPNTTELIDAAGNVDYGRITLFSAADYAFVFSYARSPKIKGLHLGGSAKIVRRVVGDFAGAWEITFILIVKLKIIHRISNLMQPNFDQNIVKSFNFFPRTIGGINKGGIFGNFLFELKEI